MCKEKIYAILKIRNSLKSKNFISISSLHAHYGPVNRVKKKSVHASVFKWCACDVVETCYSNYLKHNVQFKVSCFPCSLCDDDVDNDDDDEVLRFFECIALYTLSLFYSRELHSEWMNFNSVCCNAFLSFVEAE